MAGDEINSFTNSNGPPSRCPWRRQQLPSHVKPTIIGCSQQFSLFGDSLPHLGDVEMVFRILKPKTAFCWTRNVTRIL